MICSFLFLEISKACFKTFNPNMAAASRSHVVPGQEAVKRYTDLCKNLPVNAATVTSLVGAVRVSGFPSVRARSLAAVEILR